MAEAFEGVPKIQFEGPDSKNPLAFKHYNAEEMVEGKSMADHLRFSVAFWHCFRNGCADPFGAATRLMPWDDGTDSLQNAKNRIPALFEFCDKLGVKFFCFHDRDIAPEGDTLKESNANLDEVVKVVAEHSEKTGTKLLWGTACLFANPRYMHGAATSPNADAFAYAAAQVAKAIDVTKLLGGQGYTFWGGREGYKSLLNTDMGRELDHLGKFLNMAVDYKKSVGLDGPFYIEPKPKEPTKHQYDFDVEACYAFLQKFGLTEHFRFNIEANHATLAGHDFVHELEFARANGLFGSVDANRGDPMLGWDTDQFPNDVAECTQAMLVVLKAGGFTTGGLNFDAHVARESYEPVDLFHAHIGGMDVFAKALKIAAAIRADGAMEDFVKARYSSYDTGVGAEIEAGKTDFVKLRAYMEEKGNIEGLESGRVEMLENMFNSYL